jgi:ribosomal subunit interface protein
MKISLTAEHFELTPELEKYAATKCAAIARRIPRGMRATARCSAVFSHTQRKGAAYNTCSISCTVGDTTWKATETTQHMYAALDIATVHLQQQLALHFKAARNSTARQRLQEHLRTTWHPPRP